MDSTDQINWHLQALPKNTKQALDFLSKQTWLKNSKWYLAGGTALALQANHRRSLDLDFFMQAKKFDEKKILTRLTEAPGWQTNFDEPGTVYGQLFAAKVSFISYPFFIPDDQIKNYGFIHVISPRDIAVMKIIAISQRGRKRDFFDLYWCAHHVEPLTKIIKRLKKQYPSIAHDYHHLVKALVYFADAEGDPEPSVYFDATWLKVKKFFIKEAPRALKELMKGD